MKKWTTWIGEKILCLNISVFLVLGSKDTLIINSNDILKLMKYEMNRKK